jgi:hypothetical protein
MNFFWFPKLRLGTQLIAKLSFADEINMLVRTAMYI